ncbi:hypothetical protein BD293_2877 [Roseinatronobacter monicus]|jgi:hypothetical protein|uniref:Uncharacterized protein n=1 Tax=Roseinatronobacter monicus TaxID=393481 RepID=A0A543KGI9_9RHOB|nr:hypothetical protein BD293_2877 [Roseinatronobacter monicus]
MVVSGVFAAYIIRIRDFAPPTVPRSGGADMTERDAHGICF